MLSKISLKLFGSLTAPYIDYFDGLKLELRKARMAQTIHEYLSTLVLGSILAFVVVMILGTFFITFAVIFTGYSYTLAIIVAMAASAAFFLFGYWYPSLKAAGVKSEIDKSLPFAVFYMTTSASSGINPVEIFKVLSLRKGIIGEEAQRIYNSVKTLGMDLATALQRSAARSPSPDFSDLLWGLVSIITTGGDIETYLKSKTETLMTNYRRRLNDYAKQITLYTEVYITLVIVGSLFFIILMSIMAPLVGLSILYLQTFLVFFFIPLISAAFIVMLKSISPSE